MSFLPGDKTAVKNPAGRGDFTRRIRMNINIKRIFVAGEEPFPERREMEISISEEEKCDFVAGIGGAKARDSPNTAAVTAFVDGFKGCAAEESEVVDLIREGDFIGVFVGEYSWGEEEKQWK